MLSHSCFDSPHSYVYAAEKKRCLFKELQPPDSEEAAIQMHQTTKTSFETDQPPHNSGSSLIHVDAVNIQGDSSTIKTNDTNHEQSPIENSGFCSNLLLKKKIKSSDEYNNKDSKEMGCSKCSSSSSPHNSSSPQYQSESVPVGKSSKRRHLSMFRNLINCGAVNTNDAAHVRLNRDSNNNDSSKDIIISKEKRDKNVGAVGSAGLFRTCMDQQKHQNHTWTTASKRADDRNQKTAASAYKPIRWPHCSHCRKQFKPDKFHSHMKSCKGMKALSKNAPASVSKMP
ncbi:hypothetical protein ACLB2K_016663 [Fragaria x ananassa]